MSLVCKHHSWRKALNLSVNVVLLLCLLSSSLLFSTHNRTASATDNIFYDFVDQAPSASWSSGAGGLQFPGSDSDSRGFALYRNNWQFEDNSIWAKSLQTHPQWVSDGWIMGVYPQMTVPSGAELEVTVGFLKGATGSDGVIFEVRFEEFLGLTVAPQIHSILIHGAKYDGELDLVTADLSSLEGKTGNFILYVNAGQSSGQDWAAWAEAKIECVTDIAPPEIISGPTVSQITEISVLICWETDEVSDSLVKYDCLSGIYGSAVEDHSSVVEHCLSLTQLEPATTYHFMVESTDSSGNRAASRDLSFETLSSLDGEEPSLSLLIPHTLSGKVPISADAQDNVGVEGVIFFIDGKPVHTDYSYPFEWECDTKEYADGPHEFGAQASDLTGNFAEDTQEGFIDNPSDASVPIVTILNPRRGDTVLGRVPIEVQVQDDAGIKKIELYIDAACNDGEDYTTSCTDPSTGERLYCPLPRSRTMTFYWDTNFLAQDSEHGIEVKAYDASDPANIGSDGFRVTIGRVEQPDPGLIYDPGPNIELRRDVDRTDNYFEVTLEVENTGVKTLSSIVIEDNTQGFQCCQGVDTCEVTYYPSVQWSVVEIGHPDDLAPGETISLKYYAIPILFNPYSLSDYAIGHHPTFLECTADGEHHRFSFSLPRTPGVPEDKLDVEAALSSADYLIVTNPDNLFILNPEADVNKLLSAMAELAVEKNGVLGYFYVPSSIYTTFDANDHLACGDVDGDGYAEIIVAEDGGDRRGWVDIYSAAGGEDSVYTTFDANDRLACGDVDGDGRAEIIVAEDGGDREGCIDIYGCNYNASDDEWEYRWEDCVYYTVFDANDWLACGDVDGDGYAEIIVAEDGGDREGWVDIYNTAGWEDEVHTTFDRHDHLACGDVDGDGYDEIIIAEDGGDRRGWVDIYNTADLEDSVETTFDANDRLACGDVLGARGYAEIIVAEDGGSREGWIDIYDILAHNEYSFHSTFDAHDWLACGNVYGDWGAEIIVAEDGGIAEGWMDIISYDSTCSGDRHLLHDLIKEDGAWSNRLRSDWTSNGYLLIVGETEIVPSWDSRHEYNYGSGTESKVVYCTDIKYANTAGKYVYPELNIGRIIGNGALNLTIPIRTSIEVYRGSTGYEFDRSDALVVAGRGGGATKFERSADQVASILDDEFPNVVKLKQSEVENAGGDIRAEFKARVSDKDVIFYRDHGGATSWHDGEIVVDTGDFGGTNPVNFGNTKPFVFACCCDSGKYAGITGIAETFLEHGAAIYIGATEPSNRDTNNSAAKQFFNRWVNTDKTIGLVFKELKRKLAEGRSTEYDRFLRRHWLSEYQLYGDPKYGDSYSTASYGLMALTETEIQGSLSSLDVIVPDYEVTTVEGEDYVEIPEGYTLLELDKPLVPFYTVSLDYPKGYRVQDVILTDRSGLTTATGLNIPNFIPAIGGDKDFAAMQTSSSSEWWPEEVFNWAVFENADDSTTLAITMCPFYYNPLTTDVKFYKNYSFDIDYTVSTVEISKLETDKHVYEQGEQVLVDLEINNSAAEAKDVLVDAVIEAESSSEIVGGLLLHTLKGLTGSASFSPEWDSTGFEPGYYYLQVTLKDTTGNVLDRKTEMVRLGISSGEITSFAATPESFDIGDEIDISLAFNNIGPVDISGTAVIRVQDEAGELVQEFGHEFTDLAPNDSIDFADTWDTSGGEEGSYRILGIVFYDGQATSPIMVAVNTNYFPTATFGYSPKSPDIEQDITFDASGSSDADGEIVSFEWDFGDGGVASEAEATHRYSQYGDYEVVLTVTDNEGAIDTTWQFVSVAAPMIAGEHPRWDINEDIIVNYLDLAVLGAHYGETTESPLPRYDINCDGWVGLADCNMLVAHYGEEVRLETTE